MIKLGSELDALVQGGSWDSIDCNLLQDYDYWAQFNNNGLSCYL